MHEDLTLLILAAGMGSRFGGLKQMEPVGPNQEFLLDYSIYDAIEAGFNKVVFIIRKSLAENFKNTIENRIQEKIKVEYVYQEMDTIPNTKIVNREKPYGTAHAILCARDKIHEPFLIINADDFYGKEAFHTAAQYLKEKEEGKVLLIAYPLTSTMTKYGSVKRGICKEKEGKLETLIESKIEIEDGILIAYPLDGRASFKVEEDAIVSMNMLGFDPTIFKTLEQKWNTFQESSDLETKEYLIPDVIKEEVESKNLAVDIKRTNAKWMGMTYKEDSREVREELKRKIENAEYPACLW